MSRVLDIIKSNKSRPKRPIFEIGDIIIKKYQGHVFIAKIINIENEQYVYKYIKNDLRKSTNLRFLETKPFGAVNAYYKKCNLEAVKVLYGLS